MSIVRPDNQSQLQLKSKEIKSASSSLKRFAVIFVDGTGLLLEAVEGDSNPNIRASLLCASDLAAENEAVCKVDWSWIVGSKVETFECGEDYFAFRLEPAGPLRITVQLWQDSPFLAFRPFRPA